MSQWHREHPELVGTDADPWMVHESYRKALPRPLEDPEWGLCCPHCYANGVGEDDYCWSCGEPVA